MSAYPPQHESGIESKEFLIELVHSLVISKIEKSAYISVVFSILYMDLTIYLTGFENTRKTESLLLVHPTYLNSVCVCVCVLYKELNFEVVSFSSVHSLSHVPLFVTPWTVAHQASLSITNSWSLLKLMSIESVMPCNHLILCPLFLLPSIFPSIRVFSNESVLHIMWPSIGVSVSASVLPMNIQDWFPLAWIGWISLQSKGLSRVFSNTIVLKHLFLYAQFSLYSNSHIHTWLLGKP